MSTRMRKPASPSLKIGVRPETRKKFDAIREATRLPYSEIADVLADDYMAAKGIKVAISRKALTS